MRAKFEVLVPRVPARMEQALGGARFRIDRYQVTAFVPVAERATKCQVLHACAAPVLGGNNVIDFVADERQAFRNQAIFAAVSRPPADLGANGRADIRHQRVI